MEVAHDVFKKCFKYVIHTDIDIKMVYTKRYRYIFRFMIKEVEKKLFNNSVMFHPKNKIQKHRIQEYKTQVLFHSSVYVY